MISLLMGIVIVAAIGLGVFSYWEHIVITQKNRPQKREANISWIDFFAKGKDSGFSNLEVKLLYDLAKRSNMAHPAALFWSHVQMDGCIKYIVSRYMAAGTIGAEENKAFLDKLFEFRKKMEMEKPKWKRGINQTTEINEMQRMQLVAGRYGAFNTKLIKNTQEDMIVERPAAASLPVNFSWKGMRVQVYFWRKDDASYCFETVVSDEIFSMESAVLRLLHTSKLERSQNRTNIRVNTNKPAFMYIVEVEEADGKKITSEGINCCMKDLSDTGCSIVVGGEVKSYFKLVIQFYINKIAITLVGTVTAIEYMEEDNKSILHVETEVMPTDIRNLIRCVVFGIIDDDIEIVPPEPDEPENGNAGNGGNELLPALS